MMRYFFCATIIGFVLVTANVATAQENTNARTSIINKNFDLDIEDKRIVEQDYQSNAAISYGEINSSSVSLQIGAGVSAQTVNMRLQNIQGEVRFRGNWEPLRQKLRSHPSFNSL